MAIPKTMKALVAYGKDEYKFEPAYPTPECGPDDIIIKVEACGICAGDLKCSHGAAMFWGDDVQPSVLFFHWNPSKCFDTLIVATSTYNFKG